MLLLVVRVNLTLTVTLPLGPRYQEKQFSSGRTYLVKFYASSHFQKKKALLNANLSHVCILVLRMSKLLFFSKKM